MRRRVFVTVALLAAAALLAGCGGDGSVGGTLGTGQGQVRITLTAASTTGTAATSESPFAVGATGGAAPGTFDTDDDGMDRHLQAAEVTFSSILARNLDGELIPLDIDLPVSVDVMSLSVGSGVELPMGILPPGDYDQMVVVMTAVVLTLDDGTVIEITPPGGGWTAVMPTAPFTVEEGMTTLLELRLNKARAFRQLDGGIQFHPEFELELEHD